MEWQPIRDVQLTRGQRAVIEAADWPLIANRSWQASRRRDGKGWYAVSDGVKMHRLLMGAKAGDIVDHIDGDGLNNCRSNLRIGTQSGNCVNRKQTPGPHLRGARPKKGLWQAYIKFSGKQRSLGYYATEREAHEAYLVEARRIHGDWMPTSPSAAPQQEEP